MPSWHLSIQWPKIPPHQEPSTLGIPFLSSMSKNEKPLALEVNECTWVRVFICVTERDRHTDREGETVFGYIL